MPQAFLYPHETSVLAPVLTLAAAALVAVVTDWFLPRTLGGRPATWFSLVGMAAAGVLMALRWPTAGQAGAVTGALGREALLEDGSRLDLFLVQGDRFALFAGLLLVVFGMATLLLGLGYAERHPELDRLEHPVLVLLATMAMVLAVMAMDLVFLFLCIETFSIALYILAAFQRGRRASLESALKYFVLGAFAAGFLLYGVSLVYASVGSTNLGVLAASLSGRSLQGVPPLLAVGLALILVGLGFKIAIVPFHQWTPDVYEGAPLTVTAFMATATKVAAFAALARILWLGFGRLEVLWAPPLAALCVATIFLGNLVALVQSDLKRMLAYSAVAQAGYLMVALLSGGAAGASAMLFYLLAYGLSTLGAFGVLTALGAKPGDKGRDLTSLDALRSLGRRQPMLAVALSIFLLSLTGLPPTAGFLGKWIIFQAALDAGRSGLAVALILGSVVSAFYYLRPILLMTVAEPDGDQPFPALTTPGAIVVAVSAMLVLGALLLTGPLAGAAARAGLLPAEPAAAAAQPAAAGQLFMSSPSELEDRMKAKADAAATEAATPAPGPTAQP